MRGHTLSHYQILEEIGQGGMGVVYKARDTRLDRLVAIKVLPTEAVSDPDRTRRFVQEARAASALNHPNIVHIYAIDQHDGVDFIAMEYVVGGTLADLLTRSRLKLKDVLRHGVQIADALARAHAAGIVHRDVKPANVMVTADGHVKLLDFGLAKLVEADAGETTGRTRTAHPRTDEGTIVGTVGYMSPEQAEGRPLDARSDIFSFGAVLYEMVTGRRAFQGETRVATVSAILEREPQPARDIVEDVPPELERLIARCLRKDRDRRVQHMVDVKLALEDLKEDSESGRLPAHAAAPRRRDHARVTLAVLALAVAVTAAAIVVWRARDPRPLEPPVLTQLTSDPGLARDPALSHDGKLLAYASDRAGEGNLDIWVRQVGGGDPIRLTHDTADESEPTFSPDGTTIAFRSNRDGGGIYVVSALGGAPRKIATAGRRPRFSPDGSLIAYWIGEIGGGAAFSAPGYCRIYVIPTSGGPPRQVRPEFVGAAYPEWTPDGRHLLFLGNRDLTLAVDESIDWWVTPLDEGTPVATGAFTITRAHGLNGTMLVYPWALIPSGWQDDQSLIFSARSGDSRNLWRLRISPSTWRVTGRPERLTSSPAIEDGPSIASSAGTTRVAFASLIENSDLWSVPHGWTRPHLTDPTRAEAGLRRLTHGLEADFHPAASPDGRRIAFVSARTRHDEIWLKDVGTGTDTVLTASQGNKYTPKFSPEGTRISFATHQGGKWDIYVVPAVGGTADLVCDDCGQATDWSPDGKYLIGNSVDGRLFLVDLSARRRVDLIDLSARWFAGGYFSPDGRWITFLEVPARQRIAPFNGETAPDERSWATVPGELGEWFPDGTAVYGVSSLDGFNCLWAQRLDPATKRPVGDPVAIFHSHSARHTIAHARLARTPEGLVFGRTEQTGNIWLAEWSGRAADRR
jgi:eukaryotic-like serine/threonine-protein kinase